MITLALALALTLTAALAFAAGQYNGYKLAQENARKLNGAMLQAHNLVIEI